MKVDELESKTERINLRGKIENSVSDPDSFFTDPNTDFFNADPDSGLKKGCWRGYKKFEEVLIQQISFKWTADIVYGSIFLK